MNKIWRDAIYDDDEEDDMTYPTSTDICRANGWSVGDILEGEDEVSRDRIRITAIGEAHVLARWQYADMPESAERLMSLDFREWRKVGEK